MSKVVCEFKNCNNSFEYKANKKFCSKSCKWNSREHRTMRKRPYRGFVQDKCSNCGFVPIHSCQLDIDHIDGNNKNNSISNLQTLCSNCHRLKTFLNKDWKPFFNT